MVSVTPTSWPERALALVQETLKKLRESNSPHALAQSVRLVGSLAEAPFSLLVHSVDAVSHLVRAAHPEGMTGQLLKPAFFQAAIQGREIQLREVAATDHYLLDLLPGVRSYLTIPLASEDYSGALLLGYSLAPTDAGGLLLFAETAQNLFLEALHLQILSQSLANAQLRFDTLFHTVPEGVVLVEENGLRAWVNRSAAALLSLPEGNSSPAQVSGAMAQWRAGAENAQALESQIKNLVLSGKPAYEEMSWHFSAPQPALWHVSCAPVTWGTTQARLWTFKEASHKLASQQAATQIQELSELLSSVLNSSPSGIMVYQAVRPPEGGIADFECILCNETATGLLGPGFEKVADKHLLRDLPDHIHSGLFTLYEQVVETGEPLNLEYPYIRDDGPRWHQVAAVKLQDGLVVTFSDINDRRQAEEQVRQQQANVEALLENTTDLIWSMDPDYRLKALNSSFQIKVWQDTGMHLNVGDTLPLDRLPPDALAHWQRYFGRAFQGEQFTGESMGFLTDTLSFFEHSLHPIQDEEGGIREIAIFSRDVTARKIKEEEIQQKSQILNGILENLPVIVFRIGADGRFKEVSGSGLKTLQRNELKLVGQSAFALYPGLQEAMPTLAKGRHLTFTMKGKSDGKPWYFETYVFPDNSNPNDAIGFATEVTAQKQIAQELQNAKNTAEGANRAKSKFLANMSHEIRTPLNAILGFAQVLKRQELNQESAEYLNHITAAGQILLKTIGDVLDLTKIESGKLELAEQPFHFKEVLSSDILPYRFQALEKGLAFELYFDENLPTYLIGDAGIISQIVINLIGNSLKFTRQGRIQVSFTCSSPVGVGEIASVKIAVADTGIGIAANKQKMIFQSFSQANTSINREFGGSGLGLAIVKELVALMGGEIGVKSPVQFQPPIAQPGSMVWLTLPLRVAPNPAALAPPPAERELEVDFRGQVHVLVVDDNEINRLLAKALLSHLGCQVTMASDGREAIRHLSGQDFDLVFMDVQMPVLDGYAATRHIRQKLGKKIPIIGLSANVYQEEIDACLQSGMDDYLGKPYTEKSLKDKVVKWVPAPLILPETEEEGDKSPSEKITDLSFLMKVFDRNVPQVKEMVVDFLRLHHQMLTQLEAAYLKKDWALVASLSHNLRSSLQTVGLQHALHDTLVHLELIARNGHNEKLVEQHIKKTKEISDLASWELEGYLRNETE